MSDGKDRVRLARAILGERDARRKMMMRVLLFLVGLVALGTWAIDGFLSSNLWLFCVYWGVLCLGALFLILFCIYDMLKVMQER